MAFGESPATFAQSLCKRSPARSQASEEKPRQEDAWRGRHPMGHAREEDGRGATAAAKSILRLAITPLGRGSRDPVPWTIRGGPAKK
jgi:hypothetical protein